MTRHLGPRSLYEEGVAVGSAQPIIEPKPYASSGGHPRKTDPDKFNLRASYFFTNETRPTLLSSAEITPEARSLLIKTVLENDPDNPEEIN